MRSMTKAIATATIVAGAYLLNKIMTADDSLAKETADDINRDLNSELENITHKSPEAIHLFVAGLGMETQNKAAADFPEIERIELAFRRTESSDSVERVISIAFHSGERILKRTLLRAVAYDAVPNEIMERLVRSGENIIVYLLYCKNGEKTI